VLPTDLTTLIIRVGQQRPPHSQIIRRDLLCERGQDRSVVWFSGAKLDELPITQASRGFDPGAMMNRGRELGWRLPP
jgi:hypothetical protein